MQTGPVKELSGVLQNASGVPNLLQTGCVLSEKLYGRFNVIVFHPSEMHLACIQYMQKFRFIYVYT